MNPFRPRDVSPIFNKFAGREVPMLEETKIHHFSILGDREITIVSLADQNDPTLKEMRDEASKHGLSLRVWWPGIMGTMDHRMDRVNAHIEKHDDGKWRIANHFNIG